MWLRCQSSKNAAGQLVKANEFHPTQFPWDTFGCVRWWTHDASWYNGCITVKMEPWRCRYDHTYLQLICHNLSRLHPQKTYHGTSNWMNTGNLPSSVRLLFQQFRFHLQLPAILVTSKGGQALQGQQAGKNRQPIPTWCTTSTISRRWAETWHIFGPEKKPMLCCSNEDSGGFNLGILI